MRSPQRVATLWLLRKIAEEKRKPLVWMDTETTGFNPKKQEIISISMLDEQGKPLLKHPKTGKPLHEVRITPQNMVYILTDKIQQNVLLLLGRGVLPRSREPVARVGHPSRIPF